MTTPTMPILYGIRWRHEKTGGTYRVIATALIEADLTPAVVYEAEKDRITWVRPLAEFTDGRFICIDGQEDRQ